MFFGFFHSRSSKVTKRNQVKCQPRLEALEDRSVPSVVKVTPVDPDGWALRTTGTADAAFVSGPATPPLGSGSVELSVGSNGNSAAEIRNTSYSGTRLEDLTALSYSTYVQQDGSGGQAPYIILNLDLDGVPTTIEDQIFFEPVYQTATFFPDNPQPALALNTWQTWDALNGGWWSVSGIAGATPGTGVKSLADYLAAEPDATIVNSSTGLGGLRLVAGFGAGAWDNFVGNVDNVTVGVNGAETTYNFEIVRVYSSANASLAVDDETGQFRFTYTDSSGTHTITGTGARIQNGVLKIHSQGVDENGNRVKIDVDEPAEGPLTVTLKGKNKKEFGNLTLEE